jgi:hypothetical protein
MSQDVASRISSPRREVPHSCGTNRSVDGDLVVGRLVIPVLVTVLEEHLLVHGVGALELAKGLKGW